jgi:hypothetical protein
MDGIRCFCIGCFGVGTVLIVVVARKKGSRRLHANCDVASLHPRGICARISNRFDS